MKEAQKEVGEKKHKKFNIYLFGKYLLIAHCVPGTVLGTEDTRVNTVTSVLLQGA